MKISHKISLQISAFVFLSGVVFFIIALYWYQDFSSVRDFLENFFIEKNMYLLFFIAMFSLWVGMLSKIFLGYIFENIKKHNDKLKDYNHFLAHELKTPISVMYSNLDVLSYWYDEKIISASRKELKNMIQIIDGLLNFSESIRIGRKTEINLENFLRRHSYTLGRWENIVIHNKQFNSTLYSDELLFARVVKNLIDNALKYSLNWKLDIYIQEGKIRFENKLEETLSDGDIKRLTEKFFSKSFESKKWHGIWIPMLKEICKQLGYEMKIFSEDKKFIVEVIF